MGDFNLSHRIEEDKKKIASICKQAKTSMLQEVTRKQSINQLDYVLVDNNLAQSCYTTSYNNFISDHDSIVLRIGFDGNTFNDSFKEKRLFDKESHMRKKVSEINDTEDDSDSFMTDSTDEPGFDSISSEEDSGIDEVSNIPLQHQKFTRKFLNMNQSICWLNSCLQLILSALDYHKEVFFFYSELGLELASLRSQNSEKCLNASNVKHILVEAEDTRIASRMSELCEEIIDPTVLSRRIQNLKDLRLNLESGEQCVRDFFLCLKENANTWPDVYSFLSFSTTHSSTCISCKDNNVSESNTSFIELDMPSAGSDLRSTVENYFNEPTLVSSYCELCNIIGQVEVKDQISSTEETDFITIILRRGVETLEGFEIQMNKLIANDDLFIR